MSNFSQPLPWKLGIVRLNPTLFIGVFVISNLDPNGKLEIPTGKTQKYFKG